MFIFALRGRQNCGKTETLLYLVEKLCEKADTNIKTEDLENNDKRCIFLINGKRVGITTRGDYQAILEEDFEWLGDCDIIMCASREWGGTCDCIRSKGNHRFHNKWKVEAEYFTKNDCANQQELANNAESTYLFAVLTELVDRNI